MLQSITATYHPNNSLHLSHSTHLHKLEEHVDIIEELCDYQRCTGFHLQKHRNALVMHLSTHCFSSAETKSKRLQWLAEDGLWKSTCQWLKNTGRISTVAALKHQGNHGGGGGVDPLA